MSDIRALEPNSLWNCFAYLNAVPRPSKREERVVAFGREFAERHEIRNYGNLVSIPQMNRSFALAACRT